MASIVASPSLTPTILQQNHDVFLSFRGEDTRYNFTSHLYAALTRHQIKTYIDKELERGDEISPSLLKAINHAKLSIIVFSENYASSSWCLEELVSILKCKENDGQIIVPIFYHVNPTNIRNQTGSYGVALAEHEKRRDMNKVQPWQLALIEHEKSRDMINVKTWRVALAEHEKRRDMDKVQTWRLALTEAANLSGWDCLATRYESELVEQIAKDILQKLEAITRGGLERRINIYKQIAQQKIEKSLITGILPDMLELIKALYKLAEMKMEKASSSNDSGDSDYVLATSKRFLQLRSLEVKQLELMCTYNEKDWEDLQAEMNHELYALLKHVDI